MRRKTFLARLLPLFAFSATARTGTDAARLAQIGARMKAFADKGEIAGALTLLLHSRTLVHHDAVGWFDTQRRVGSAVVD